jgi:sterol 14-demethylase
MADETETLVRSLGERGEFELWETAEHLALTIAAKAVLGADFWSRSGPDFYGLFRDIARGMDYILPPNLPLPRFLRRNRARKQLYAAIKPLILQRRQQSDSFDDLFQSFALATYADGTLLPIDTVVGLILIMIHGAYETVAAQASWCLIDLISRPGVRDEILAEMRDAALDGAGEITAAGLARLPLLKSVVQESARLRPAATVVCRYSAAPLTVAGYTIAPGALVMICPGVAHRLPEVFMEPDAFVADRFLNASFDPEQYLTFGGGLHRCMGSDFAIAEIMVISAALLRRYDLGLETALPEPNYDMSVTRPAPPCKVSYRFRKPSAQHARHVREDVAMH